MTEKNANVQISDEKPRFRVPARSYDGLANLAQGLGNPLKDKLAGSSYQLFALNRQEVTNAYFSSWLSRRIVDIPADDMTTKPPEITLDDDISDGATKGKKTKLAGDDMEGGGGAKQVTDLMIKTRALYALNRAIRWARLYGGAVAIIVTKKGNVTEALDTPLDLENVEKDGFCQLLVTDRWGLAKEAQRITDPASPYIGDAEFYQITYIDQAIFSVSVKVHRSRIIPFYGNRVPALLVNFFDGWGDSVLTSSYDAIRAKDAVSQNIGRLTFEATVDTITVPDLAYKLSTNEGESDVLRRFQIANVVKGINSLLLLDGGEKGLPNSGEQYSRNAYTFSGLKDVVENARADVAGSDGIPVSRLFGTSATGLNATGDNDMDMHHERIARDQVVNLNPAFDVLIPVLIRSALGKTVGYSYKHQPLKVMSDKDRSAMEYQDAQRDNIYEQMGAVTPGLVARELDTRGTYQAMTDDDVEAAQQVQDDPEDDSTDPGADDPEDKAPDPKAP